MAKKMRRTDFDVAPIPPPLMTPAELEAAATENLIRYLNKIRTGFAEDKAFFVDQLDSNPTYALNWSKSLFEMAALDVAAAELLGAFSNAKRPTPFTWAECKEYCTEQVLRHTDCFNSTSPTANLMKLSTLQAWARILDKMKWL